LQQADSAGFSNPWLRIMAGLADVAGLMGTTHTRPSYEIDRVMVGNREVEVVEEVVDTLPFGQLLHFTKPGAPPQPKVLVVAPMSGHFATLLRGTVRTLLGDHDVYITDWGNARDVPLSAGRFGFAEYVAYVIRWLEKLGGRNHVLAVCQPSVAVLAAVAIMGEDMNRALPRSMTLMAGPIDTRISPTTVNVLAQSHSIEWFERELIQVVPWPLAGHGRRVYPGHTQLTAFMSMNLQRHLGAQFTHVRNFVSGQWPSTTQHRNFYDEYLAVMDLPAEFYLETVEHVFQKHDLPLGRMHCGEREVNLDAVRHTFVFTVEGEQDDICSVGQTAAALDLCRGLRPSLKRQHLQTGVGHYGVFSGRRWTQEVYPMVREVIESTTPSGSAA
jgi:poly(3-hydroxybutyrate) depolymerase